MNDRTSVAVLGTGIMGAPMARNLCRAGHDVAVWNRTRAKAEPLAADGVRVTARPDEAVSDADVVITMLRDAAATAEIMRSAAPGLRAGTIWMQCTTAGTDGTEQLAELAREYRLTFLDAPVLGTRKPAEDGALTMLVAGPGDVRARITPVLDALGSRTLWAGNSPGAATRLKLVCNSWVLTVNHGVAEALVLAEGLGVAPRHFLEAVAGGGLDMGYLRMKSDVITSGDYTPSFAVDTAEKDSGLIVAAAREAGVRLDVAEAGQRRFQRAAEAGHGEEDMAASYYASFEG